MFIHGFNVPDVFIEDREECNHILQRYVKIRGKSHVFFERKPKGVSYKNNAYVYVIKSVLHIEYKRGGKLQKYRFRLDGATNNIYSNGGKSLSIMNRMVKKEDKWKVQRFYADGKEEKIRRSENEILPPNASPVLYANKKYTGQRFNIFGYDMNSMYAYCATMPIPNIATMRRKAIVGPNQIGFTETIYTNSQGIESRTMMMIEYVPGRTRKAEYVFDLMESPYKHWAETKYEVKKNAAKGSVTKIKAKNELVMGIGQLANVNPFVRNTIVLRANKIITNLINKYKDVVVYANTDSIYSKVRIPELDANLGDELGQWKFEHENEPFAMKTGSFSYQCGDDVKVRGVSKNWFKEFERKTGRHFDILTDKLPDAQMNIYKLNTETLVVEEI